MEKFINTCAEKFADLTEWCLFIAMLHGYEGEDDERNAWHIFK